MYNGDSVSVRIEKDASNTRSNTDSTTLCPNVSYLLYISNTEIFLETLDVIE